MFQKIFTRHFTSKLYSNVAKLQKQKTLRVSLSTTQQEDDVKTVHEKSLYNENYVKAFKTANEKQKQARLAEKKINDIQKEISENYLSKINKINYDKFDNAPELISNNKSSQNKDHEILLMGEKKDDITAKLRAYQVAYNNLNSIKKQISNCEEIMDLSNKLNNEKYRNKSLAPPHEKFLAKNEARLSDKVIISSIESVIKKSHLYEAIYYRIPFCNLASSPNKYKEPFINYGKENQALKNEFEHEVELLNQEINKILVNQVETEMKDLKLSDIQSTESIFNDPIKINDNVGYLLEESNKAVQYDSGIEIERLYYVVNKEDDFGKGMSKEEGEKKRPKEAVGYREKKKDMVMINSRPHFPYVVDGRSLSLIKSNINL